MPTCPSCHADIDHLIYNATVSELGTATLYAKCDLHLHEKHTETDHTIFICPKCHTLLLHNQDDAITFLLGKGGFHTISPKTTTRQLLDLVETCQMVVGCIGDNLGSHFPDHELQPALDALETALHPFNKAALTHQPEPTIEADDRPLWSFQYPASSAQQDPTIPPPPGHIKVKCLICKWEGSIKELATQSLSLDQASNITACPQCGAT